MQQTEPVKPKQAKRYSINEIIALEAEAIRNIPQDNPYGKAIALIIENVHQRGGRLVASGMGKAGQIAANIATTFSSTGTPAYFLHPCEAQHGDLGIIRPGDVMLLVSNSGKTREVIELVKLSRNLVPDLPMILITGKLDSELARAVDICLSTGDPCEVCPLNLTPTTSTTAMTVIGDVLVVNTMQNIQFGFEDYARRHHGGYLGDQSRKMKGDDDSNDQLL